MPLTKRHLITDDLELAEYDRLARLVAEVQAKYQGSPSYRFSVRLLVWPRYDAYQRASQMESPPEHLFIDEHVASWATLREKFRRAADAYEEMLQALR